MNSTIDTAVGSISLHMNFLTNIFKPYVMAIAYTDSGNNLYDLELFNRTINVCMFFGNKRYEPLLQLAYQVFKRERGVSIPTRCPINKVYVRNYLLPLNSHLLIFL